MSLASLSRLRKTKKKARSSTNRVRSKNIQHHTLHQHHQTAQFIRNFNQDQRILTSTHHEQLTSSSINPNDPWQRMTKCLHNTEPLTVRMALLELSEHFNQTSHDTTLHLNTLGAALIDVMSSSTLGLDIKMIASSMIHQCVAKHPDQDKTPWIRKRAMHILSNSMKLTFNVVYDKNDKNDKNDNMLLSSSSSSVTLLDRDGKVSSRLISSIVPWLNTYHLWCENTTSTHTQEEIEEEQEMFNTILVVMNNILSGKAMYVNEVNASTTSTASIENNNDRSNESSNESNNESSNESSNVLSPLPSSTSSPPPPLALLQVTVLKSLALYVRRTPRNRELLAQIISTTRWLASSVVRKKKNSNPSNSSKFSNTSTKSTTVDILLQRSITLFLTIWYPIPCDLLVRCLPSSIFPHEASHRNLLNVTKKPKIPKEKKKDQGHSSTIKNSTNTNNTNENEESEDENDNEDDSVIGYLSRRRKWLQHNKYWINNGSISSKVSLEISVF